MLRPSLALNRRFWSFRFDRRRLAASNIAIRFLALVFAATAVFAQEQNIQRESAQRAREAGQALTISLISAQARLTAALPGDRARRLTELIATATARRNVLAELAETDPAEALRVVLPPNVRAAMPPEAAALVESEAQEDGELGVYHVDYVDPALDHYRYVLATVHGSVQLQFATKPPVLPTGSFIRVNGVRIGTVLLASSAMAVSSLKAARTTATKTASTVGPQSTLTILVNFTDDTSQPFSPDFAKSMMFTTVNSYLYEASYQQTTVTGDVAGWFTIPVSTTTCDYQAIATYAQQAAAKAGFSLSQYTRFVYVFPGSSCPWWGQSYIGGTPSQSWIAARQGFTLAVIGHELGHALGLYHSHSLDCGSVELASSGCTMTEYGDMYDLMGGSGSNTPHYNAFQKEQLGWLNAGISPPITTISAAPGNATYTIAPLEVARSTTPRALKIPRPAACGATADYLYVESRQAVGFDSYLSGNAYALSGVLVHDATPGNANSSSLLDMTPSTASWQDAALAGGVTFTDSASGLTVTPLSVGSGASSVSVSFPPAACVHSTPSIVLAPGGTAYTTAGGTAAYTVTVTNNDSCNCTASVFDVSAGVPTGWSTTSTQTPSVPPGASISTSLAITAASSAAVAFYTVPSIAANAADPYLSASADATVAIVASLTVNASTDSPSYTRPTKRNQTTYVLITVSVTSSGTPIANASTSVQVQDSKGATTTYSVITASNGVAYVSYPIKSSSAAGIYSATATVNMGTMSNTGSASFAVN